MAFATARFRIGFLAALVVLGGLCSVLSIAEETQHHGLEFEAWVQDTFFDGYRPEDYTQKWDIPATANTTHGGIPVNPKATRYGSPVDLGDALRQFDIDEPFILVVGYWRQEGETKRFVNVVAPRIEPATWRKLWSPLARADLEKLDALVKDRSLAVDEVRARATAMKSTPPFSETVFVLNPKIDAHGQRRLQCSLSFETIFTRLCPEAEPAEQVAPKLWGVPALEPIASEPRRFAPR